MMAKMSNKLHAGGAKILTGLITLTATGMCSQIPLYTQPKEPWPTTFENPSVIVVSSVLFNSLNWLGTVKT